MKSKFFKINQLKLGNSIKGFYVCKNVNSKITRLGDKYVDLFLEDKTGLIRAKIWSNVDFYLNSLKALYPVAVKGKVISYNNDLEIDISFIKSIDNNMYDKYGYQEDLLFKYSTKKLTKDFEKLISFTKSLHNDYKKTINVILKKYKDEILTIPSIDEKYSFKGGFLIQIVCLLTLNLKIYKNYSLDLNFVVMGIIFKNIGLLKYFNKDISFSVSKESKIKGYRLLGLEILDKDLKFKNQQIENYLKRIIMNDFDMSDIYLDYINNIYNLDSKINI